MRKLISALAATSVFAALLWPGAAGAHTAVTNSSPKNGEVIEAAPEEVWAKFGNTPATVMEGRLEVVDPCGDFVHQGESELNLTQDTLTVAMQGTKAGRYEVLWFVTGADGHAVSGYFDFEVTSGEACDAVEREDPAEDVTKAVDIVSVASDASGDKAIVEFATAEKIRCKDLNAGEIVMMIDRNSDDAVDYEGTFSCVKKKKGKKKKSIAKLTIVKPGNEEEGTADEVVSVSKVKVKGTKVLSKIPTSKLTTDAETPHFDFFLESTTDEECGEGEVCVDRAPDLGLVRSL